MTPRQESIGKLSDQRNIIDDRNEVLEKFNIGAAGLVFFGLAIEVWSWRRELRTTDHIGAMVVTAGVFLEALISGLVFAGARRSRLLTTQIESLKDDEFIAVKAQGEITQASLAVEQVILDLERRNPGAPL